MREQISGGHNKGEKDFPKSFEYLEQDKFLDNSNAKQHLSYKQHIEGANADRSPPPGYSPSNYSLSDREAQRSCSDDGQMEKLLYDIDAHVSGCPYYHASDSDDDTYPSPIDCPYLSEILNKQVDFKDRSPCVSESPPFRPPQLGRANRHVQIVHTAHPRRSCVGSVKDPEHMNEDDKCEELPLVFVAPTHEEHIALTRKVGQAAKGRRRECNGLEPLAQDIVIQSSGECRKRRRTQSYAHDSYNVRPNLLDLNQGYHTEYVSAGTNNGGLSARPNVSTSFIGSFPPAKRTRIGPSPRENPRSVFNQGQQTQEVAIGNVAEATSGDVVRYETESGSQKYQDSVLQADPPYIGLYRNYGFGDVVSRWSNDTMYGEKKRRLWHALRGVTKRRKLAAEQAIEST